jgi:hypothetical protein
MEVRESSGHGRHMALTLTASTGAKMLVWSEGDTFCARLAESAAEPEICLGIDLFEVIAELAGLDLEEGSQAAEALELSQRAQRTLAPARRETKSNPAEDPPDGR